MKKKPRRKNVIYHDVSVWSRLQSVMCEVDDEKCACSEYAILILSFFFSTEWPCLIDWSPESTTDRHIQSSTQTDDGDGREEKMKNWMKRRERGNIMGESNQGADCSVSLSLAFSISLYDVQWWSWGISICLAWLYEQLSDRHKWFVSPCIRKQRKK